MKTRVLSKNLIVVLLILVIPLVCSFTATISNPRMVLYENMTGEVVTIENSVIVVNDNENEVIISVTPTGIWEDKVEVHEKNFILKEEEVREVFYTITIDKAGAYQGDILVTFEEEGSKNKLSLAQELEISVKEKNSSITGNSILDFDKVSGMLGISIFLILGIIILIAIKSKRKKK